MQNYKNNKIFDYFNKQEEKKLMYYRRIIRKIQHPPPTIFKFTMFYSRNTQLTKGTMQG